MNNLIISSGVTAEISNAQEAIEKRDDLLLMAHEQAAVTNAGSAADAASVLKEIKNYTRMIEAARVDVKAPILELVKRVDGLAKELTLKLDAEASRIGTNLAAWQTEQNRIAEEARQDAWRKEQRILQEAREKEEAAAREAKRLADEAAAVARKQQEELEAKAARARTESGRQRAIEEAAEARRKADEADAARKLAEEAAANKREDAVTEAVIAARVSIPAAVGKQAGVSTKRTPNFRIVDIVKLYEACPYMVKLEPNTAVILAAIKQLAPDQHLPGVEHWFGSSSIVR